MQRQRPNEALFKAFERAAAFIRHLVILVPEETLYYKENAGRYPFSMAEHVAHTVSVWRFTVNAIQSTLTSKSITEQLPDTDVVKKARAVAEVDMIIAARIVEEHPTKDALLKHFDAAAVLVAELIEQLSPENLKQWIEHPTAPWLSDACEAFFMEMVIMHARQHYGQMRLQARQRGHSVPSSVSAPPSITALDSMQLRLSA